MNEYKLKVRDSAKVEKIQKESYQRPILQTREELTEFLIQNRAYPYRSKKGTIFIRRIKPQNEDGGLFEKLINDDALDMLGLETEEDCRLLLAIILRTGDSADGVSAEELAKKLLNRFGSFRALDTAFIPELSMIREGYRHGESSSDKSRFGDRQTVLKRRDGAKEKNQNRRRCVYVLCSLSEKLKGGGV